MPESRDRQEDVLGTPNSNRLRSFASGCRGRAFSPVPFVLDDDVVETPPKLGVAAAGRGRIGTPRRGRGRRSLNLSILPSLYPRKPLKAMTGVRRRPPSFNLGNIPKILLSATKNQIHSPQKKLLENIELVEKLVMEELRRLRTTHSANKAEREKRVRTLMSMR